MRSRKWSKTNLASTREPPARWRIWEFTGNTDGWWLNSGEFAPAPLSLWLYLLLCARDLMWQCSEFAPSTVLGVAGNRPGEYNPLHVGAVLSPGQSLTSSVCKPLWEYRWRDGSRTIASVLWGILFSLKARTLLKFTAMDELLLAGPIYSLVWVCELVYMSVRVCVSVFVCVTVCRGICDCVCVNVTVCVCFNGCLYFPHGALEEGMGTA